MKNILLPTDLSVHSLWPVKKIVDNHAGSGPLTIHVMHMLEMPTGLGDLLFFGRSGKRKVLPQYFKEALQILQSKYNSDDIKIKFEFFYGNTSSILKNYLEGAKIEEVILLDGYTYKFEDKESVDFTPLFKKVKVPVQYLLFKPVTGAEFQVLSILLSESPAVNDISFRAALAG